MLSGPDRGYFKELKRCYKRRAHKTLVAKLAFQLSKSEVSRAANSAILETLHTLPAFARKCGLTGAPESAPLLVPRRPATTTAMPFARVVPGAPKPSKIAAPKVDSSGVSLMDTDDDESDAAHSAASDGAAVGALSSDPGSNSSDNQLAPGDATLLRGPHRLLFTRRRVPDDVSAFALDSLLRSVVRALDSQLDACERTDAGRATQRQRKREEDAAVSLLREVCDAAGAKGSYGGPQLSAPVAASMDLATAQQKVLQAIATVKDSLLRVYRLDSRLPLVHSTRCVFLPLFTTALHI
jgi:hypothetical protein